MERWQYFFAKWPFCNSKVVMCTLGISILTACSTYTPGALAQISSPPGQESNELVEVEDGKFRCPEAIATPSEREQEVVAFLLWTKKHHPEWTLEQIMAFRVAVLSKNGCSKTLENIKGQPDIQKP